MGKSKKPVSPPGVVACMLLLVIAITSGCMGIGKVPVAGLPEKTAVVTPDPSPETSAGENVTIGPCPLPPLQFDNLQDPTEILYGFSLTGANRTYPVPVGSVIYHSPDGITRVFDPSGMQLLMANDSGTLVRTPGGLVPATEALETPAGSTAWTEGDITHIYLNGSCVATVIDAPLVFFPMAEEKRPA